MIHQPITIVLQYRSILSPTAVPQHRSTIKPQHHKTAALQHCVLSFFLIPIIVIFLLFSNAYATVRDVEIKKIAILPFNNLSDNHDALSTIVPLVKKEITKTKGFQIVPSDILEDYMRRMRIRYTDSLSRVTVRRLGKMLNIDAIMIGSVDLFKEGNNSQVGVSLRLLSTKNGSIIWIDSLSYSAYDFVRLLGLGKVGSVVELSRRVVEDLISKMDIKFVIEEKIIIPFEVEDAEIIPEAIRGEEKVDISVRLVSIVGRPSKVIIGIEGKNVSLKEEEEGIYHGSFLSPVEEGEYPIQITAIDQDNNSFDFYAMANLVVDTTPPKINIKLSNKIFSPNGDQTDDNVIFSPRLEKKDDIDRWYIAILNADGKRIREDDGIGIFPRRLIWRGRTNTGARAEDGIYTYEFLVIDKAGNQTLISDKIILDITPPRVKISLDIRKKEVIFNFNYDLDEKIDNLELKIYKGRDQIVDVIRGDSNNFRRIVYRPKEDTISNLFYTYTATDIAGNTNNNNILQPIMVKIKARYPKFNNKKGWYSDF